MAEAFESLRECLPFYLTRCRWFASKASRIASVDIWDDLAFGEAVFPRLLFLDVSLPGGSAERYVLPLSCAAGKTLPQGFESAVICQVGDYFLIDGAFDPAFRSLILEAIARGETLKAGKGKLVGTPTPEAARAVSELGASVASRILSAEQSNTSIVYGDRLFLKLYRRVEEGPHPEGEMVRFLAEVGFSHVPPFMGSLEYKSNDGSLEFEVALLQRRIENEGDAWSYFTRALKLCLSCLGEGRAKDEAKRTFAMASLLGRRTAELHKALASKREDPAFAPVPFEGECKERALRAACAQLEAAMASLEENLYSLPEDAKKSASYVLERKEGLSKTLKISFAASGGEALRIHGDYHLGQVLFSEGDFFIIDFEGEPARSLLERREKQSPLKDISGMIRSFHYAANFALRELGMEKREAATSWAEAWNRAVCESFLSSYRRAAGEATFLPQEEGAFDALLKAFLVEKAAYEVCYELNNRPDWVEIPLAGIVSILDAGGRRTA